MRPPSGAAQHAQADETPCRDPRARVFPRLLVADASGVTDTRYETDDHEAQVNALLESLHRKHGLPMPGAKDDPLEDEARRGGAAAVGEAPRRGGQEEKGASNKARL